MLVHAVGHRKASKPQAAVPICLDLRRHTLCPDMWSVLCLSRYVIHFVARFHTIASLPVLSKQNYQHHCPYQSSFSFSSSSALASRTGPEFDFWFKSVTFTKPSTPRLRFVPKAEQEQEACLSSAFVLSCYTLPPSLPAQLPHCHYNASRCLF